MGRGTASTATGRLIALQPEGLRILETCPFCRERLAIRLGTIWVPTEAGWRHRRMVMDRSDTELESGGPFDFAQDRSGAVPAVEEAAAGEAASARREASRLVVASAEATIAHAAQLLERRDAGAVVALDGGRRPVGLVSERDLIHHCVAGDIDPARTPLRVIVTSPPVVARAETPVDEALAAMAESGGRWLVIVDERGRFSGAVGFETLLSRQVAYKKDRSRRTAQQLARGSRRPWPGMARYVSGVRARADSVHRWLLRRESDLMALAGLTAEAARTGGRVCVVVESSLAGLASIVADPAFGWPDRVRTAVGADRAGPDDVVLAFAESRDDASLTTATRRARAAGAFVALLCPEGRKPPADAHVLLEMPARGRRWTLWTGLLTARTLCHMSGALLAAPGSSRATSRAAEEARRIAG